MRKTTSLAVLTLVLSVSFTFGNTSDHNLHAGNTPASDSLEGNTERQMLSTIDYIEDEEEVDLGIDSYFYLPFGFNPYVGMEFDLNEIEYIDLEEEL